MLKLATSLLLPVAFLFLTTETNLSAAELAALNLKTEAKICKPVIGAGGILKPARSQAEISAISAWNKLVDNFGKEYTLWHNAEKKQIRCAKAKKVEVYLCYVEGAPCKNQYVDFSKFHSTDV